MLWMEVAHGDSHSSWFGGRSHRVDNCYVTKPQCLINLHLCTEKESKSLALREGWIVWGTSRHPGDHRIFLLELNWWVLFQTTHMGMRFIFISSSENLCPLFSHWEITLFSVPAYHKIRPWSHSVAFIRNCSWTSTANHCEPEICVSFLPVLWAGHDQTGYFPEIHINKEFFL